VPAQSRVERWLERPEPPPVDRWTAREKKQSLRVIPGGGPDPEPRRKPVDQPRQQDNQPPRKSRSKKAAYPRASLLLLLIAVLGVSLAYMTTRPGVLRELLPAFASRVAQPQPAEHAALQAPPVPTKGQQRIGAAPAAGEHAASQPPGAGVPLPDVAGLVILVRNAIVALDQANDTGNYSVLREIAAPDFQTANTPARLSEVFTDLRTSKFDLAPATVINPRLNQEPALDEHGMLRLVGFFPFSAGQVDFDLSYQLVGGRWRLFGIGLKPAGAVKAKSLPSSGMPQLPDSPTMVSLIRSSIIALNQANLTGNYSVLRDLSAPGFQQGNSFAKLSEAFSELRARQIDFAPVAVIDPRLFRPPAIDDRGRLRLTGYFPSQPEQVNFDLAFQIVDGQWRLFGVGLNTSREMPLASQSPSGPLPAEVDRQFAATAAAGPTPGGNPAGANKTSAPPLPRAKPVDAVIRQ
jgi:hypothetical protein